MTDEAIFQMLKDYTLRTVAKKTGKTIEEVKRIKRKFSPPNLYHRNKEAYDRGIVSRKNNHLKDLIEEVNRVNGTNYVWREV